MYSEPPIMSIWQPQVTFWSLKQEKFGFAQNGAFKQITDARPLLNPWGFNIYLNT